MNRGTVEHLLPATQRHTIVLVDDEQNIINSLQRLLRREGYQIVTSTSGQQALDLLDQLAKHGGSASVIVSDFRMPGMDGVKLLSLVREQFPETVRIILSGYADAETVQSAINEGQVYKFIAKPWDDDELKELVRSSTKQFETIANARTVLGRASALQKEAERVGLTLFPSPPNEEDGELDQSISSSEPPSENDNSTFSVWQQVVSNLPAAVIGVDRDGLVAMANPYVQRLLGIDRRTILGSSFSDSLPSQLVDLVREAAGADSGRSMARVIVHGRSVKVECVPLTPARKHEGRGIILVAFAVDDVT
ncbi:MAG: response regulator [Chloroflexi bacterium]|nr:response regulator [Chloroflexota bacterium]